MKYILVALALFLVGQAVAMPLNPAVTQENIHSTICMPGWSATQRPSRAYTSTVKHRMLRQAGLPANSALSMELDHVVAISIGGAPRDPENLRLQPWKGADGARAKDAVEAEVHRRVCAGRMTLGAAQTCMWKNWQTCLEPPHAHR